MHTDYLQRIVALVLVAFTLSAGCATLFTGSSDNVSFNSEPPDAKVYLNGNYMGNTPTSLILKRDKDYNVMVKKEGYEPGTATISRSFNAVAILNLFGLLCWLVDIVTGAVWKFDRDGVTVTLEKTAKTSSALKPGKIVVGHGLRNVEYNGKTAIYMPAEATH